MLKLALPEEDSAAMRAWATDEEQRTGALWSSDLLRAEALRAARRHSPTALTAVRDQLERMALISLTTETFRLAGELDPTVLRSLDALHVAAAMSLGDDLDGIVTYDDRMVESARMLGLIAHRPSRMP